jgi:hypothetical protein
MNDNNTLSENSSNALDRSSESMSSSFNAILQTKKLLVPVRNKFPYAYLYLNRVFWRILSRIYTRRFCKGKKYVFILGHMRSGSSLLYHILANHKQIIGCGERNADYFTSKCLPKLARDVYIHQKKMTISASFFLDQINHDQLIREDDLLDDPELYIIFLIRQPLESISSMVKLFGPRWRWTFEDAAGYYIKRLATLARYAGLVSRKTNCFFLTYSQLVNDTGNALKAIQGFLELKTPISEHYELTRLTGKSGDPSENIKAGRVLRDRKLPPLIDLPVGYLPEIQNVYDRCRERLEANCILVQ